jgi:O-antigen/teichoic acid export membrane protein
VSKIIKNTSFYTIGNILPQAVSFFLLPIYTHYLTPADYGIISSLQVLNSILTIFFTLAIDRSVYRLYFDHKTETDRKDYLGTITIALFFISCIVLLLVFVFRETVGQIYKSIQFYPYYSYAILSAFFAVFQIMPKIYFQVNEKAGKFVLISIAQFILNAVFTLWFVVGKVEGAAGMLKGEFFANIIIAPLVLYISYKTINFKFKSRLFFESLKFSAPIIPGLLSAFVLNLSDRIFIERYFNLAEVGIYSLGYKIAGLIGLVSTSFLLAYGPIFYKYANSENQIIAKEKIAKYNHAFIIIVIILSFLISLFSKEAIILLLDPKYKDSYKIIPIIAFGNIVIQITSLFNLMIYQNKKSIALMLIGLTSAGVCILINFILIPIYGMYGAAFATVLSFIIVYLLTWSYAMKCYYVSLEWKKIALVLIPLMIVTFVFQYMLDVSMYTMLIIKITFCCALIFFFLKTFNSQIKIMFKK